MRCIALFVAMIVASGSAVAQNVTHLSPEDIRNSPHWQPAGDGIRHVPSGVVCPISIDDQGLSLVRVSMYRRVERDVSCQYRSPEKAIMTLYVTDFSQYRFDDIAAQSDKDVVKAKGLTRLEPGSGQCDGILEKVLQQEPRATKAPASAHCALYASKEVHSTLMLASAREWTIKLRHTRSGAPDVDRMTKLLTSSIDVIRSFRRGVFEQTQ